MSRAWMPLYWGDYLRDTRDLSTLQHGAYLLLMAHYWQHAGLPNDEKQLAAIVGLSLKAWRTIAPAIAAKFQKDWRHKRIDAEIAKTERAIAQRRQAGAKGGHRTAISRAIAVGAVLRAAEMRSRLRDPAAAAAGATARTQQPVSIHNHNQNLDLHSSESSAARAQEEKSPTPPDGVRSKRPNELSHAEIEAIHARRRAGVPGDAP
jgi:uncharacterized protein YdaU (DUF1376 family)